MMCNLDVGSSANSYLLPHCLKHHNLSNIISQRIKESSKTIFRWKKVWYVWNENFTCALPTIWQLQKSSLAIHLIQIPNERKTHALISKIISYFHKTCPSLARDEIFAQLQSYSLHLREFYFISDKFSSLGLILGITFLQVMMMIWYMTWLYTYFSSVLWSRIRGMSCFLSCHVNIAWLLILAWLTYNTC